MKIQKIKISSIKPYFNNPRENNNAISPVAESIQRYGFIKPIIVDKDGVIMAGHTRYFAALRLNLNIVPVIYSDLSEEKAKLFRIADNKLAEKSVFDEDKLIEELRSLELPESMQAFFFEDVNDLINFNPLNIIQSDNGNDYNNGDYYSETDEDSNEAEYNNDNDLNFVSSSDIDDDTDEDNEKNKSEVTSDTLYQPYSKDGRSFMKVICPYCNNIEEIEVS